MHTGYDLSVRGSEAVEKRAAEGPPRREIIFIPA
jgi:hypothetical protein